ncbi:MAG: hypothetical protein IPI35_25335 [Deltaproteobacteria bacterium]|nr:hypothetical protein [Deltaproteobacteria bacterium]
MEIKLADSSRRCCTAPPNSTTTQPAARNPQRSSSRSRDKNSMRITDANTATAANTTPMTPGSPAAVRISAAGPTLSHRVNPPQIQIAAAMP